MLSLLARRQRAQWSCGSLRQANDPPWISSGLSAAQRQNDPQSPSRSDGLRASLDVRLRRCGWPPISHRLDRFTRRLSQDKEGFELALVRAIEPSVGLSPVAIVDAGRSSPRNRGFSDGGEFVASAG